jgi:hypothetical protein
MSFFPAAVICLAEPRAQLDPLACRRILAGLPGRQEALRGPLFEHPVHRAGLHDGPSPADGAADSGRIGPQAQGGPDGRDEPDTR